MNKELEDDNFLNYQFLLQQFFGCLVRIYGFIINCQQLDMQYFRGLEPAGSRYHLDEAPTVLRIINCSWEQDTSWVEPGSSKGHQSALGDQCAEIYASRLELFVINRPLVQNIESQTYFAEQLNLRLIK